MKKLFNRISLTFLCFTSVVVSAQGVYKQYEFDKSHSFVIWRVKHLEYSEVVGKFLVEGNLSYDPKNPDKSKVVAKIKTNSLVTGMKKFDKKLLSRSFFNADEYPVATFTSENIKRTGKNMGVINGSLNIRNVTKPVKLTVKLNKEASHPMYRRHAMGFTAYATIKRSDFGMRAYIPALSDQVKLEIQVEVIEEKPKVNSE